MKKILSVLSFFICLSAAAQNIHHGTPATAGTNVYSDSLSRQSLKINRIFNVMDYGADSTGATDCTSAIQSAINACSNAGGGTVWFPSGTFLVAGALQTSVGGMTVVNSQIYLPYTGAENLGVTVRIKGESGGSPGNMVASPFGTSIPNKRGTRIYSTYSGTQSTTLGRIAVFGTGLVSGLLNFSTFVFDDIQIIVKNNPNGFGPEIGGIQGKNLQGFAAYDVSVINDTIPTASTIPTREVVGIESPDNGNGGNYPILNCSVSCLRWGIVVSEHVSGDYLASAMCFYGFGFKGGSHAAYIGRACSQWCVNASAWFYPAGILTPLPLRIVEFDIEFGIGNTGKWYNSIWGVIDSLNQVRGDIHYSSQTENGSQDNSTFAMKGGALIDTIYVGYKRAAVATTPSWDATLAVSNTTTRQVLVTGNSTTRSIAEFGSLSLGSLSASNQQFLSNMRYASGYQYMGNGPATGLAMPDGGMVLKLWRTGSAGGSGASNFQSFAADSNFNVGAGGSLSAIVEPTNTYMPGSTATFGITKIFLNAAALPTGSSSDSVLVGTVTSGVHQLKMVAQSSLIGATPTLQQVLTAGSTLTTANTIASGSNQLTISGSTFLSQQNSAAAFGSIVSASGAKSWTFGYLTNGTAQTNGSAFVVDSNNNVLMQSGGGAVQYTSFRGGVAYATSSTITSGTSSTIANAIINTYINPASLIATYTLTLPSAPLDGTEVDIYGGGTITSSVVVTSLTISPNSGQSIVGTSVTTLSVGPAIIYHYNSANTSWYRKQ